ncbi:hypothetical protein ACTA71_001065 [Dictyostelium dimigraforme]
MYGFNLGKAENANLHLDNSNKKSNSNNNNNSNNELNKVIDTIGNSFQFKDEDDDENNLNNNETSSDEENQHLQNSNNQFEEEDDDDDDEEEEEEEFISGDDLNNNGQESDDYEEEEEEEEEDDDEDEDEESKKLQFDSFFGANVAHNMDFLNSQNINSQIGLIDPHLHNSQLNFEEPQEEIELPAHACAYCATHELSTVVKCMHPSCGKWFCNGKGKTKSSHIITHLVKSKHKEVALHPESSFGDTTLECFNCGCKNIFLLGFITAKTESVVVLLCRDPCASGPSKEVNWDMSSWQPLINGGEKAFCSWLVKTPSQIDSERSRQITIQQILRLEEFWKMDPQATLLDIEAPRSDDEKPASTQLAYKDAYEYREIISPLIELEAKHEKELRESLSQSGISIEWSQGINKRYTATFPFSRSDLEFKVVPGDELKLQFISSSSGVVEWEDTGRVIQIDDENLLSLETKSRCGFDSGPKGSYRMEMVWRSTSSERILSAMKSFAIKEQALSSYLYHALLGHPDIPPAPLDIQLPTNFHLKNLPRLNESQISAVNKVLTAPLSLIQGPPGTGKTVISSFIIHHLVKYVKGNEKVLVCTPSNVAIDQLTGKLHEIGLKVVRLSSKLREEVASPVEHLTLHKQVYKLDQMGDGELGKLRKLKEAFGSLNNEDEKRYIYLRRMMEMAILRKADVICATCVGAGDPRLSQFRFPHILIDESTQASEPECLIPLMMGAKQVILVGDHRQLGPVLLCKKVVDAGLSQSLFERLISLGHHPERLTIQYRMHPSLTEFPSNTSYEGQLVSELSHTDRDSQSKFPWPQPKDPMFFFNCTGSEEISASGTSFINTTEASICEKIVTKFLELGSLPGQIGIITPYEGQRAYITSHMQKSGKLNLELYKSIEVASVDSFQGREKDYIILSCVRSNDYQGIGFLQDPRRLNVALTRARFGLIILGNAKVLSKDPLWNSLISHFKNKNVLVEGSLANLKPSPVILQKPKKLYGQGKLSIPGQNSNSYDREQIDPNIGMNMVYGISNNSNNQRFNSQDGRYSNSQSSSSSQTYYGSTNASGSSNTINSNQNQFFNTPSSYSANTGSSYQYRFQQEQQLPQPQQQSPQPQPQQQSPQPQPQQQKHQSPPQQLQQQLQHQSPHQQQKQQHQLQKQQPYQQNQQYQLNQQYQQNQQYQPKQQYYNQRFNNNNNNNNNNYNNNNNSNNYNNAKNQNQSLRRSPITTGFIPHMKLIDPQNNKQNISDPNQPQISNPNMSIPLSQSLSFNDLSQEPFSKPNSRKD